MYFRFVFFFYFLLSFDFYSFIATTVFIVRLLATKQHQLRFINKVLCLGSVSFFFFSFSRFHFSYSLIYSSNFSINEFHVFSVGLLTPIYSMHVFWQMIKFNFFIICFFFFQEILSKHYEKMFLHDIQTAVVRF